MILTQDVTTWAEIEGTNFRVTKIDVERFTGRQIGRAKVSGIPQDIDALVPGSTVEVFVSNESTASPWVDVADERTSTVFKGKAHKAEQDEEGIVTVTAYDVRDVLHSKEVVLDTEFVKYPHSILFVLLADAFPDGVTQFPERATIDQPYLAPFDAFVGGRTARQWSFGSGDRGDPLMDVVQGLARTLLADVWVDKNGALNITPSPKSNSVKWDIPFITETNAGDDSANASRVVFETSDIASEYGQGASSAYQDFSHKSPVPMSPPGDSKPLPTPEKNFFEVNASTQEEADKMAVNEAVKQDQTRNMGTATIIGNGDIELYDQVVVPELEFTITGTVNTEIPNNVQQGIYKVNGVTHTINAQDGFLTTLELTPTLRSSAERIDTGVGASIVQQYLAQEDGQRIRSENISGIDDKTGIGTDILN